MEEKWYKFRLVFQFCLILFVSFYLADNTFAFVYWFFNIVDWDFKGTNNIELCYISLVVLTKMISLPLLYYFLKSSHIKEIEIFLSNIRTSKQAKRDVFILTLFLPVLVLITTLSVSAAVLGFGMAFVLAPFLYACTATFCLSTWCFLFLNIIWWCSDRKSNKDKTIEIIKNEKVNPQEIISIDDVLSTKISTFRYIYLNILTYHIFEIYNMFKMRKILNNLGVEIPKISKWKIYLYLFISILLVPSVYLFANLNTAFWALYVETLGLLLYSVGFLYVLDGLRRLEYLAFNQYGRAIKYNRIYAFMFGSLYLNFAINNYEDRINNTKEYDFTNFLNFLKSIIFFVKKYLIDILICFILMIIAVGVSSII